MKTTAMNFRLAVISFVIFLITLVHVTMADNAKEGAVRAESEVEGDYVRGLTSEEIMNLPDMPDEEDPETAGMTIDQIIERANQMGRGSHGHTQNPDEPYIVQGDIAMTKEQYEEHMAEWKKQEAELIAKGEIKPGK